MDKNKQNEKCKDCCYRKCGCDFIDKMRAGCDD